MVKEKNVYYDVQKLDEVIREIDGDRYNKSRIGLYILGKSENYYGQSMTKGKMSSIALDKLCKFYGLNKKDYIIDPPKKVVEPVESSEIVSDIADADAANTAMAPAPIPTVIQAEPTDLTPVINMLTEMISEFTTQMQLLTKSVTEVLAENKSTNFMIGQLTDRIGQHYKAEKDIFETIEQNMRFRKNNNNKFRS